MAPYGEVDKVLETVVNNLEVTNNLDIQPEVRCRVLMTSTLESFTIGHTIVLSRGLVDVLPVGRDFVLNRWPLLVDPFEDENGINGTIHKENPFPIFGLIDVPGPALATGSLPWGTTKIFTFGFSS